MTEPFVGDESRQATAALAGYAYQLWWSLYSWCVLQPREDLYLERAEDFDVVRPEDAEIVQVKNRSRPLSLVSPDALQAIRHWWQHQERNAAHRVQLRFLTTASPTVERERPFGDEPGIVFWNRAQRIGVDPGPLRTFLIARQELPRELRDFVAQASDEKLRQEVVRRLSWDYGSPALAEVRALVERELVETCIPAYGLYAKEAKGLAPQLLDLVIEAILRPEGRQPLTNGGLREAIDNLLTETRPRQQLRALEQLTATFVGGIARLGGKDAISFLQLGVQSGLQDADLVTPKGFVEREDGVAPMTAALRTTGILVLRGSTGMGKSRLALLTMGRFGGSWRQVNLRGRKPDEIHWELLAARGESHGHR